jgi:death-on-curing protein
VSAPDARPVVYLTFDDVLGFHADLFGCSTQGALDRLRNRAGLEGALARPAQYAYYQEADLALQAAVLAHGIAESQVFIDGNKRTALVTLASFLEANGLVLIAAQEALYTWMLDLSAGLAAEDLAGRIRPCLASVDDEGRATR